MSLHHPRPDPDAPYRYACPDCDSIAIERNAANGKPGATGTQYYCNACGAAFDTPVDRKEVA